MTDIPFDLPRATALLEYLATIADSWSNAVVNAEELRSIAARLASGERDRQDAERWRFVLPRLWIAGETMMSGKRRACLQVRIAHGALELTDPPRGWLLDGDVEAAIDRERAARSSEGSPNT